MRAAIAHKKGRAYLFLVFMMLICGCVCFALGGKQEIAGKISWPSNNYTRIAVGLNEFRSGGPGKDGIAALDSPSTVPNKDSHFDLDLQEPVVVFHYGRSARAYALRILIWHEIINDSVAGRPIAVTYCPLCNAAIIFDRHVAGRTLDFGTTGLLRNSDLVMYDRQTQSWWQQFTGECLAGKLVGARLPILQSIVMPYSEFLRSYPSGQVSSLDTGHLRAYGTNPYRYYDNPSGTPFLYDGAVDPRLPLLERVLGVVLASHPRAYGYHILEKNPVVNDSIGEFPIVIVSTSRILSVLDETEIIRSKTTISPRAYSSQVASRTLFFIYEAGKLMDAQTRSIWNTSGLCVSGPLKGTVLKPLLSTQSFAFAWFAFFPKSTVYALPSN